jgi:Undecaprenyl-phosphate glucose phosphotransferase
MQRRNNLIDFRRRVPSHAEGAGNAVPYSGSENLGADIPKPANDSAASGPGFQSLEQYHAHVAAGFRAVTPLFGDRSIALGMAAADFIAVIGSGLLAGAIYHFFLLGDLGPIRLYGLFSVLVATCYSAIMLAGDQYQVLALIDRQKMVRDALMRFVVAFSLVGCLIFMAKAADDYSRVTLAGQFAITIIFLFVLRNTAHWMLKRATKFGMVRARRVALVGPEQSVLGFARQFQPWNDGVFVVATSHIEPARIAALRDERSELSQEERERLETECRNALPDDVILVLPWDAENLIREIIFTLSSVPAAIHVAPERMISWLQSPSFAAVGSATTLSVIRAPLSTGEQLMKRLFDITTSATALVLAAPILGLAALAIKLQDGGPVFYRQARHGFNQKTFEILKFRSMRVAPPGEEFAQATKSDGRVTPVGRFLRKTNIDELPQLINVLKGDMSLVGPRPHALQHNEDFEDRIALYARRHNVKPGITGWAQVNGFRGPTDTLEKMDQRVDCDLYYIDNWSLLLDLRIILLTIFSRRAYRNAH